MSLTTYDGPREELEGVCTTDEQMLCRPPALQYAIVSPPVMTQHPRAASPRFLLSHLSRTKERGHRERPGQVAASVDPSTPALPSRAAACIR